MEENMQESMQGIKRSYKCAELSSNNIGEKVTVMGWVQKRRNLGSLLFIDLRDVSGIVQIMFDETKSDSAVFEKANSIRSEFVIAVTGTVVKRSGAVNKDLKTGEIEIEAESLRILSASDTPPFPIEPGIDTKEEIRLKNRTLDLRRSDIRDNIIMRSKVTTLIRQFLSEDGFLDIETPMLTKSTPEGARDYLVPSRVHPGEFYALPQSPQLFKQMLMCAGFDRYMQIARCFRDEDLRADRQPEFTQVDLEMSFVEADDVMDVTERLIAKIFNDILGIKVELPLKRMTWREAMDRFGSDKPDIRFGMELKDVSDIVKDMDFVVFNGPANTEGQSVRAINATGFGDMPRKQIDALVDFAKGYEAKGLAYIQIQPSGDIKCSFSKFLSEDKLNELIAALDGKPGDLLLFAADRDKIVFNVLGALRLELADRAGLRKQDDYKFLWVTEFPQFEWSDEEERFIAMHHPFTMPFDEDVDNLLGDKANVRAKAYDIVLNGIELGGGSVRIHQSDVQEKMFNALGISTEEANEKFGFLLDAFKYGVPPHAGLAIGLDRLIMLMSGSESIRDVIAFPKVKDASCLLTDAPNVVDSKQLDDLHINIIKSEEE